MAVTKTIDEELGGIPRALADKIAILYWKDYEADDAELKKAKTATTKMSTITAFKSAGAITPDGITLAAAQTGGGGGNETLKDFNGNVFETVNREDGGGGGSQQVKFKLLECLRADAMKLAFPKVEDNEGVVTSFDTEGRIEPKTFVIELRIKNKKTRWFCENVSFSGRDDIVIGNAQLQVMGVTYDAPRGFQMVTGEFNKEDYNS